MNHRKQTSYAISSQATVSLSAASSRYDPCRVRLRAGEHGPKSSPADPLSVENRVIETEEDPSPPHAPQGRSRFAPHCDVIS